MRDLRTVRIDTRIARKLGLRGAHSALLKRGDKVTGVLTDLVGNLVGTARGRVTHAHRGRVSVRTVGLNESLRGAFYRKHEGRTWARGWDTPEASALTVEVALMVSR